MYFCIRQAQSLKLKMLKRFWSYVDFFIIIFNIYIVLHTLFNQDYDVSNERHLRIFESIQMLLLWFKSLYYLALVGQIAPLIDSIFMIVVDIRYFMVVYIILMIGFINAYFLIGKNQLDILRLKGEEGEIPYDTWFDALIHVYKSSQGDFSDDSYYMDSMWPILLVLFFLLNFMMSLTLLNMLIAIMGETFSANQEIAESKKRYQQLQFVVENWWIDPIPNKQQIVYIIGGFQILDEHDDDEKID